MPPRRKANAAAAPPPPQEHADDSDGDNDGDGDDKPAKGRARAPLTVPHYYLDDMCADHVIRQREYSRAWYNLHIRGNEKRLAALRKLASERTPAQKARYLKQKRDKYTHGRQVLLAEQARQLQETKDALDNREVVRAAEQHPPQPLNSMLWVNPLMKHLRIPADLVAAFGNGKTIVPEPEGGWYATYYYKAVKGTDPWSKLSPSTRTTYLGGARLSFLAGYPDAASSEEGKAALASKDPLVMGRYIVTNTTDPWNVVRGVMLADPAPSADLINSRSKGIFGVVAEVFRDVFSKGAITDTPFNRKLWLQHMIYEYWGAHGRAAYRVQRAKQERSVAQAGKFMAWDEMVPVGQAWLSAQRHDNDVPRKDRQDQFVIALMINQGWVRSGMVNTVVARDAEEGDEHNAINPDTGIWYMVRFKNMKSFKGKLPVLIELQPEPLEYLRWLVDSLPAPQGAGAGAGAAGLKWLFPDFTAKGQKDPEGAWTRYVGNLSVRVFGRRLGQQVLRQAWIGHLMDTKPEMYKDIEETQREMSQILQTSIEHHLSYLRKRIANAKTVPRRQKLERELSDKFRTVLLGKVSTEAAPAEDAPAEDAPADEEDEAAAGEHSPQL